MLQDKVLLLSDVRCDMYLLEVRVPGLPSQSPALPNRFFDNLYDQTCALKISQPKSSEQEPPEADLL